MLRAIVRTVIAGVRHIKLSARSCPDWRKDLAMLHYCESDLEEAERQERSPKGSVEYASEILTLNIQGMPVAKSRYEWAQFKGLEPLGYYPFLSYDTEKSKGVILHNSLLDLVQLNRSRPDLSLDELYELIQHKYLRASTAYYVESVIRLSGALLIIVAFVVLLLLFVLHVFR